MVKCQGRDLIGDLYQQCIYLSKKFGKHGTLLPPGGRGSIRKWEEVGLDYPVYFGSLIKKWKVVAVVLLWFRTHVQYVCNVYSYIWYYHVSCGIKGVISAGGGGTCPSYFTFQTFQIIPRNRVKCLKRNGWSEACRETEPLPYAVHT